ncbi:MAG: PspC domain-containing protein [Woeseiaceae bacterium]|nr:PspC domain-containing protein [Woeseiaceae bacterium]MDX2608513.1 PspC domain-containing protein [Woeseiaceae bacterium]
MTVEAPMYERMYERRFCRRTDRALLGGVCAGFADYFGFNLRVTRLLAIIAFVMAMPMAVITYLAIVFLVPADSSRPAKRADRKRRRRTRSAPPPPAPSPTVSDVRRRCQSLDKRMAHLEKYVTSSRYNLDREFRSL